MNERIYARQSENNNNPVQAYGDETACPGLVKITTVALSATTAFSGITLSSITPLSPTCSRFSVHLHWK